MNRNELNILKEVLIKLKEMQTDLSSIEECISLVLREGADKFNENKSILETCASVLRMVVGFEMEKLIDEKLH